MKLPTLLAVVLFALIFQGNVGAAVSKADPAVPQVELYVTSWCPYCVKAENFFRAQGIPFTVYDVERDSAAARRKDELDTRRGVPFAIINGQKIHGYSESAYREALAKKP
jgi:glutaredoxin